MKPSECMGAGPVAIIETFRQYEPRGHAIVIITAIRAFNFIAPQPGDRHVPFNARHGCRLEEVPRLQRYFQDRAVLGGRGSTVRCVVSRARSGWERRGERGMRASLYPCLKRHGIVIITYVVRSYTCMSVANACVASEKDIRIGTIQTSGCLASTDLRFG
jgi:hypothetical protein